LLSQLLTLPGLEFAGKAKAEVKAKNMKFGLEAEAWPDSTGSQSHCSSIPRVSKRFPKFINKFTFSRLLAS